MKAWLANLAIFQVGWTVCVLGGDIPAIAFTLAALVVHHLAIMRRRREWLVIALVSLVGVLWDSLLIRLQVLVPAAGYSIIPLWLACLWVLFATTIMHCLAWLDRKPLLSACLACLCGPLAYWIGGRLAGVELAGPQFVSLIVIGFGWGLLMPGALLAARLLAR